MPSISSISLKTKPLRLLMTEQTGMWHIHVIELELCTVTHWKMTASKRRVSTRRFQGYAQMIVNQMPIFSFSIDFYTTSAGVPCVLASSNLISVVFPNTMQYSCSINSLFAIFNIVHGAYHQKYKHTSWFCNSHSLAFRISFWKTVVLPIIIMNNNNIIFLPWFYKSL